MKKKLISGVSAAALVLLMVLTMIPAAFAAEDPTDVHWDGKTARWIAPTDKTVSYYMLSLIMDGNNINDYTTSNTYYDFTDTLKNGDPGDYVFSVCAVFDDTSKSSVVSSASYSYAGEPHTHPIKWVDEKKATCTEQGVKGHFECPVCDKYFEDSYGINEIEKDSTIIQATGHDWGEWHIIKEATTTEKGEEERICKNDSSHVEKRDIPMVEETQPTTKAQETTKAEETTAAAAALTTSSSQSTTTASDSKKDSGDSNSLLIFIIACIVLAVIVPCVIILVIMLSKKKKQNADDIPPYGNPPVNGSEYPPMNGSEYLPTDDSEYPPMNGSEYLPTDDSEYPRMNGSEYLPRQPKNSYPPRTSNFNTSRDLDVQRTKAADDEDNFDDYSGFDRK